jgi:flagellar basal body rod protein FlgG
MAVPQILASMGMQGLMAVQRAVSDNLANASTSGFKKIVMGFHQQAGAPTPTAALDLAQGKLEATDNPLDVALDGPGFLVVRTTRGDRLLRGGSLTVNRQGELSTREGEPLVGVDGATIHVGADVAIDGDGTVRSDGKGVGRLRVVDCDAFGLAREGAVLRSEGPLRPSGATVKGGCLEAANVETVGEMVQMMQTLRSFELLQQVVRADDEMQQRLTSEVGRAR